MLFQIDKTINVKASAQRICRLFRNLERFSSFIKYVKKIKILKKSKNRYISHWIVDINGARIMWREEERFYNNKLIKFRMSKGDYTVYNGIWYIESNGKNTRLRLTANVDWGAPKFLRFAEINKILKEKTERAMQGFLIAIKKEAERV